MQTGVCSLIILKKMIFMIASNHNLKDNISRFNLFCKVKSGNFKVTVDTVLISNFTIFSYLFN